MSARVFLIVYLLCYVYSVLSQLPSDGDGEGRTVNRTLCAALINDTAPDYERTLCRVQDFSECYEGNDPVTVETDTISHVDDRSMIHAEINPNSTSGLDAFYYVFCLAYNWTLFDWNLLNLMACPSGGSEVDVHHKWRRNGNALILVQVFSQSVRRHPLGCNFVTIPVAGDFGLALDVDIYNDVNPLTSSNPHSSIPSPTASPGNGTKIYITGNITFVPKPTILMANDEEIYEYVYTYEFGDNSSIENSNDSSATHLYERPGNYSYSVEGTAVGVEYRGRAYYKKYEGILIIYEPVANATMGFNHNNSIKVNTKVNLHIACAGSLPIGVCWLIQPVNSSLPMLLDPNSLQDAATCISLNTSSLQRAMMFKEKGKFEIVATFHNNISTVNISYTFEVVADPKPTIVATTTSVGVVLGIVVAIIVVLGIMAVGGYLPYRRYRSQMIETADFKFVDLSDRKMSAWQMFKLKVSRLYAQIRPHRNSEKIGLVNLISGPQFDSQTSSSPSLQSSQSSQSYNTF